MLVTVFCAPRDSSESTFSLDVSPELELRDFVALCELESGIPAAEIQVSYAEQPLRDLTRALGAYGLKDGDVLVLRQADRRPPPQPAFPGLPRIDFSSIAVPGTSSGQRSVPKSQQQPPRRSAPTQQQQQQGVQPSATSPTTGTGSSPQGLDDPSLLRDMLLANPHELSLLKERNPPLAEALLSGDLERFTKVLLEQQQDRARREQERIRLLTADPFDLEAQAKIEEDIRQHNIEENMTIAMEEAPESFGQVVMLYINCEVNGHPVKAFVDSGAQMTIMSQACAERCNIMRLVDRRWAGIAKGVGTQKIIGRVHLAQVKIEGDFLPCSFSLLEDQPMDMLLGLDMLKRHQCSIDLKKSVLLIGTTGSETRFLPEAELPECARLAYGAEGREDAQPDEIADRELAEALQRSVQESDTEDGQTTSPRSPPLALSKPYNDIPLSSSASPGHPRSLTLDRSKSAPASMRQTLPSECSQSQPHFQGVAGSSPLQTQAIEVPIPPSAPAQDLSVNSASLEEKDPSGLLSPTDAQSHSPVTVEVDTSSGTSAVKPPLANQDLSTPTRDSDQEVDMSDATDAKRMCSDSLMSGPKEKEPGDSDEEGVGTPRPHQLAPSAQLASEPNHARSGLVGEPYNVHSDCEESMEAPSPSWGTVPLERDQPEGDNIPSLAQALQELHELLVSNSCALSREGNAASASHSPTHRQDADGVDDDPTTGAQTAQSPKSAQPAPSTATSTHMETSVAKATHTALPDGESTEFHSAGSMEQVGDLASGADVREEQGTMQCPDVAVKNQAGESGRGLALEPEDISPLQGGLEFREPPEGQQGRGVADGRASGTDTHSMAHHPMEQSQQSPLSMAVGSPDEDSSLSPLSSHPLSQALEPASPPPADTLLWAPPPATEQFPAEHIQRIQAAGFSAREAAEALEQAQGSVELALLVLLARKITVPT